MRADAFRAGPGQDLKKELVAFVSKRGIHSACVLTCVGSLQSATLRLADHSSDTPESQDVVWGLPQKKTGHIQAIGLVRSAVGRVAGNMS